MANATNEASGLFYGDDDLLEQILERFEQAWADGKQPAIEEFLPEEDLIRSSALIELALIDLERRLKSGETIRIESYLQRFPELSKDQQAMVDLLVAEYSLRHQREPDLSLAEYQARFPTYFDLFHHQYLHSSHSFSTPRSVGFDGRDNGPDLRGGRGDSATGQMAGITPVGPSKDEDAPLQAGRFRIVRKIARGGMGVVLQGYDAGMRRTLAVKVMRHRFRNEPEFERRFFAEAQITGQLQHPGIAPIHEMGRLEDGRPFFAMKLIAGKTLESMLKERKESTGDLPRFVSVFQQVCQTLAFAHSRGVIHRDLKPGNIMVGEFGEVQVMDWGLAKQIGNAEGAVPNETEIPESGTANPHVTAAGVVLGTPAYMPPEQARGEIEKLDPRCDVFALGAILCEMLTGKPPYVPDKEGDPLAPMKHGHLENARMRLEQCGADAELIQLARLCLAAELTERPKDAGAVARAIDDYQEQLQMRFRQAETQRAQAEIKIVEEQKRGRVERQRSRLAIAVAGLIVVLVAAGSAAGIWHQRIQAQQALEKAEAVQRTARTEQDIRHALDNAASLRSGIHAQLAQPGGVFALLNAPDEWKKQIQLMQASLAQAESLARNAQEEISAKLMRQMNELSKQVQQNKADHDLAVRLNAVRQDKSLMVAEAPDHSRAANDYESAFRNAQLAITSDQWREVSQRIKQSAIKDQLTAALDDWALSIFAKKNQITLARIFKNIGLSDLEKKEKAQQVLLLRVARQADPGKWQDQLRDAKSWFDRQAVKALAKRVPVTELSPHQSQLFGALLQLHSMDRVVWLRTAQDLHPRDFWLNYELAIALNEKKSPDALGFARVAITLRPQSNVAYNNLGVAHLLQENWKKSEAAFQKTIDLSPRYVYAYVNLSLALEKQKQFAKAGAVLKIAEAMEPENSFLQDRLGLFHYDRNQLDEARRYYEKALQLDPKNPSPHLHLGNIRFKKNDVTGAVKNLKKAIDLDSRYHRAYFNLGLIYQRQKNWPEAIANFKKTIELAPKFVTARLDLGNALFKAGKVDEAIEEFKMAVTVDPQFAAAYSNLGNALYSKRDIDGAVNAYRRAIAIDEKAARAHYSLGLVLSGEKKYKEAADSFERAIAIDPEYAQAHGALGMALLRQGEFRRAADCTNKSLKFLPVNHPARLSARQQLLECNFMIGLEEKLPRHLKDKSLGTAQENLALGEMCYRYKKRHSDAVGFYKTAFAGRPELASNLKNAFRLHAACAAAMAMRSKAANAKKTAKEDLAKLRRQALDWLKADLDDWQSLLKLERKSAVLVVARLKKWLQTPDLAHFRDGLNLAALPDKPQKEWLQLWQKAQSIIADAKASYSQATHQGALTRQQPKRAHKLDVKAGRTYVLDLHSKQFDPFLRLEDAGGKLLLQDDDSGNGLNAQIIFTAKTNGPLHVVATSFRQQGTGSYTLVITEFVRKK